LAAVALRFLALADFASRTRCFSYSDSLAQGQRIYRLAINDLRLALDGILLERRVDDGRTLEAQPLPVPHRAIN